MRIVDCYIENFGRLSDFSHSFSGGLNTIKKNNGYGKTTLTVFIKAMLYGLDDTKKMKLEENDRRHYLPWQGGRCGGSLTIEVGGKRYRIERSFMPKAADDTFKLYDAKTMKESSDYTEKIGEEILGIDADGFLRTVFLSEANLSGKNENKTVSAKLSSLVGYDGDLSVMDEAMELIEKQRKFYYKRGGGGEIGELEARISDITREINDLSEIEASFGTEQTRLSEICAELSSLMELKKRLIREAKAANEEKLQRTYKKQYLEMKAAIDRDEATLSTHREFFKNGTPDAKEIDDARELYAEARRISAARSTELGEEYKALADIFKGGADGERFEKAEKILASLDSKGRDAEHIRIELNGLSGTEGHAPTPADPYLPLS